MPYTINFDNDKQIIRGKITGRVDRALLWQYTADMKTTIKKENVRLVLADFREADFPFSTIDVFHLPDEHNEVMKSINMNLRSLKRAMLFKDKNHELVQFYENVATNRGQNVKAFTEESVAIDWLLDKSG